MPSGDLVPSQPRPMQAITVRQLGQLYAGAAAGGAGDRISHWIVISKENC
jgi:hypothetical protein